MPLAPTRPIRQGAREHARRSGTALLVIIAAVLALTPPTSHAAEDEADRAYAEGVLEQALETARSQVEVPWRNPATGSRGVIIVERTFYLEPDAPCRDYRRTLERPGEPTVTVRGTGCRAGAGRWQLDEEPPEEAKAKPTRPPARTPPVEAAADCPPPAAAPEPPAFADYTMPSKAAL